MTNKEKLANAISALADLEGVPIRFDMHAPLRELQEMLQNTIEEIEQTEIT